ncbi:glycosyltransferase family 4 protein [Halofilum ochraceum]|uniref:glycosyltransferase family 4 protein n=1 Tax=Halofilum ochraceum TaxID=1611323 RepID=UPI0008DB05F9|nr:glycosyltransferase family 1 protein [Halofilum ochraceum]
MRFSIITDAWYPQVNGVVTTLAAVIEWLRGEGHSVDVIEPGDFRTIPCPGYPEIRLALGTRALRRRLDRFAPERVHVVTEGPLGHAAIRHLRRRGWRHTTSFHTRFPEYVQARLPFIPLSWGYALLRRFHRDAAATLVPTAGMARELSGRGFGHLVVWNRGVDTRVFSPDAAFETDLKRPIHLFVGRVSREKNIEAFLAMDTPGTKVVVGDGPDRERLQNTWPDAVFPGYCHGRDLAAWFASADVFVFPSRTDTYGVVMLEAMACGTPVAAYPVTGPIDVVQQRVTGYLDEDLARAARNCLDLDEADCIAQARANDWRATARFFLEHTVPVKDALTPGVTGAPADI